MRRQAVATGWVCFLFFAFSGEISADTGRISVDVWAPAASGQAPRIELAQEKEAQDVPVAPGEGEGLAAEVSSILDSAEPLPTFEEVVNGGGGEEGSPAFIKLDLIDLETLYRLAEEKRQPGEVSMSLEECVLLALRANQDIMISALGPLQADGDILSALGVFDPALSANARFTEAQSTASSQTVVFGGITEIRSFSTSGQTAVGGRLPWGLQYSLSLDMSKEESTFNRFVEEWSGGLSLTLTQPLLRGFGPATLASVRIAKNSRKIAEEQVRLATMTTLAEVIKAYWDLVGAIKALEVREKSLETAERLLEVNERRYELEVAAALEVQQAKAGVAARQSEVVSSRTQRTDAEDRLKRLLNLQENGVLSTVRVIPVTKPDPGDVDWANELPDWDETFSIERALANRPEIARAEMEIANAKLDRQRARNNMLPQVDVFVSGLSGGRDHKLREVIQGIEDSHDQSYSVGFQASVPITNRVARGQYHRSEQTLRQAELSLEKTKQDLIANVRLAMRAVASSRVLVESNKQTRMLQEANLAAEEKRLNLGVTTSYRVLEVENDLTVAELNEAQAMINFEKSLVELRLAEGVLLEELGIEFEAPKREPPVSYFRSVTPFVNK